MCEPSLTVGLMPRRLSPYLYPTIYHLKPLTDFRFSTTVRNMAC